MSLGTAFVRVIMNELDTRLQFGQAETFQPSRADTDQYTVADPSMPERRSILQRTGIG